MPAVTTATEIVHEDLSDALILADVRNTPLTSRMKKGPKLTNMLYSWPVEVLGARNTTPPAENADVSAFEGDIETRIYNRAERFWRTPRVSIISEKVNETAGDFGRYSHQVTKKIKDQKRDIEYTILSTQDSNDDTGAVGARYLGLAHVINDGTLFPFTDNQTVIPATYRTPTAQIYSGSLAAFTEDNFVAIMKSRFDNLGQTTELLLFAGSSLKNQISTYFGKYTPNRANFTTVIKTEQEAISSRRFAGYGIDLYEGDYGSFEIVLTPFIFDQKWGYGVNMDYLVMRPLMYCDVSPLPYQGGGMSGLVDSIVGYEFGDPRGHFALVPQTA